MDRLTEWISKKMSQAQWYFILLTCRLWARSVDLWIGLFKSNTSANSATYWLDGNPSTFRAWASGYPTNKYQCVVLTPAGQFEERNCSCEISVLCKKRLGMYVCILCIYLLSTTISEVMVCRRCFSVCDSIIWHFIFFGFEVVDIRHSQCWQQ